MFVMWVAKIILKHDCIIGNRCEKFNVSLQTINLAERKEKDKLLTSSMHLLIGEEKQIQEFLNDLKKDKRVYYLERNGNTLFLIESATKKPVSQFMKKTIFITKPMVTDTRGFEHWEIASHSKNELMEFIKKTKPLVDSFELLSIKDTPLKNVYFPKIMPELTDLQRKALELAIKEGYYQAPKKTNLRALAKQMKVSLATYQKHLQKAESKVIPDTLSFLK